MNKVFVGIMFAIASQMPLAAMAEAPPIAAAPTPLPGFAEGQIGVGWSFVDFAGATEHQRGGDGYGVNNGLSVTIAAQYHPSFFRRLGFGATAHISLTGATNDAGGRYFNPMAFDLLATFAFIDPEQGPFVRLEGGIGGVTRKLRSEDEQGVVAVHDFGIGWSVALGLGYRFHFARALTMDLLATYERQGARVERTGLPNSQWSYGVSTLTLAYVFE